MNTSSIDHLPSVSTRRSQPVRFCAGIHPATIAVKTPSLKNGKQTENTTMIAARTYSSDSHISDTDLGRLYSLVESPRRMSRKGTKSAVTLSVNDTSRSHGTRSLRHIRPLIPRLIDGHS